MDIPRGDFKQKKKRKAWIIAGIAVVLLTAAWVGVSRLEPAIPKVQANAIWTDTVRKGSLLRTIRGSGTLVPEKVWWISANTGGVVQDLPLLPGSAVEPDTVIVELSNPDLIRDFDNAKLRLKAVEADLSGLKIKLQGNVLESRSGFARIETDYKQAQMDVEVNEELFKRGLIPQLTLKRLRLRAADAAARYELEKQILAFVLDSVKPQLAVKENEVEQVRSQCEMLQRQVGDLQVRAGIKGVLQRLTLERGQKVSTGQAIAQVADPTKLKAVIRIAEMQAKDIQLDQVASIDTRNGVVSGQVVRVDPTVDAGTVAAEVKLTGELPRGARPDLTIDGEIELEKLPDVLYVKRPVSNDANSSGGVYKFAAGSTVAMRTLVRFGRSSLNSLEVLDGLQPGDKIIISDMSRWDQYDKIRVE